MIEVKMDKFTMEDVEISMSLSPDANRERLIKMYAYLNFHISKGWKRRRVLELFEHIMENFYTFKFSKLDKTRH
jgi:hypothetical protein